MPKPLDRQKIEKAIAQAGQFLVDELGSLTAASENGHFRPKVIQLLDEIGVKARVEQPLNTALGDHPFDIAWNDGSAAAAIELKLAKARTEKGNSHPADNTRLGFWYDLKWLELAVEAASVRRGWAVLLTDLQQIYEETGRGRADDREDHYRIGHRNGHRCQPDGPDHRFDLSYRGMSFVPGIFPLTIRGCYDFRDKWKTLRDGRTRILIVSVGD